MVSKPATLHLRRFSATSRSFCDSTNVSIENFIVPSAACQPSDSGQQSFELKKEELAVRLPHSAGVLKLDPGLPELHSFLGAALTHLHTVFPLSFPLYFQYC